MTSDLKERWMGLEALIVALVIGAVAGLSLIHI